MTQREGRSPWFYIGLGCGGLVLLAAGIFVAIVLLSVKVAKTTQREMLDPDARHARAVRVLGAGELPPGYHAAMNFSIPILLDVVILTDTEGLEGGRIDPTTENMFIFLEVFRGGRSPEEMTDEKTEALAMLEGQGIRLDSGDTLLQGDLTVGQQRILYSSSRGSVRIHGDQEMDGLTSVMYIGCPDDKKLRMGIWIGPDPAPDQPDDSLELAGTHADPAEIRSFMSWFDVCG
jgi:hypothetical protein